MRKLSVAVLALVAVAGSVAAVPAARGGREPAGGLPTTVTVPPFASRSPMTRLVRPMPWWFRSGPATRPRVALTIDDLWGTSGADNVTRVLDVAREKNVKLTFFPTGGALLGHLAAGRQDVWQRVVAEGHEIGNHTSSHPNLTRLTDEQIRSELDSTADALARVLGATPYVMRAMRPPGGAGGFVDGGDPRIMQVLRKAGYSMVMWTIDANGASGNLAIAAKILNNVKPGSIVLFHFTEYSADGFGALIDELRKRGLEPVTVSALVSP